MDQRQAEAPGDAARQGALARARAADDQYALHAASKTCSVSAELRQTSRLQLGEILARMMRGARQRARGDQKETLGIGGGFVGLELVRRHEADHRMVLLRRLEVLADGHEIHIAPSAGRP